MSINGRLHARSRLISVEWQKLLDAATQEDFQFRNYSMIHDGHNGVI